MGAILLIVLLALLFGSMPIYPYTRRWSYYPSGALALLIVVLLVLIVLGNLPWWSFGSGPVQQGYSAR